MRRKPITIEEHNNNIGKTFGRLTVLQVIIKQTKRGERIVYYQCQCECGNKTDVYSLNLLSGKTSSCGCYRNEQIRKANYIGNKYEEKEDYIVGYTLKNEIFYIDKEDLDKVSPYTWSFDKNGYLHANVYGKTYTMHRLIMGTEKSDGMMIDHINHNKFDNRKSNLRIVTPAQNAMNSSIGINNTSGVVGVVFNKQTRKWDANITINYKAIRLGQYKSFNDAVSRRKRAENEFFQNYSYDNSLKISPLIEQKRGSDE